MALTITIPERQITSSQNLSGNANAAAPTQVSWSLTSTQWDDVNKAGGTITAVISWRADAGSAFQELCRFTAIIGTRGARNNELPGGGCGFPAGDVAFAVTSTTTIRLGAQLTV